MEVAALLKKVSNPIAVFLIIIVFLFFIYMLFFYDAYSWQFSGGDPRKTQSDSYWRNYASPFAILNHSQTSGYLVAIVRNVEPQQKILNLFAVGGGSIPGGANATSVTFRGGEQKTISLAMSEKCAAGSKYDLNVTFGYDDGKYVKDGKNLIGKCT